MKRSLGLLYGILCYLSFLAVFLRGIWFVWADRFPRHTTVPSAECCSVRAAIHESGLMTPVAKHHPTLAQPIQPASWA